MNKTALKIAKSIKDGSILHKVSRKINTFIEDIEKNIIRNYYWRIPVKRTKIVFDNFGGEGFGDNPKYIAKEIYRQHLPWDMVWLVNDMNTYIPNYIRKVQFGSARSLYELASAKIWIDNVRNAHLIPKKKNQVYLQTWHGGMGLKAVEKGAEEYLDDDYIALAQYDGSITDLMIAENSYVYNKFRRDFWYTGEILKVGIPRNDILFDVEKHKCIRKFIRKTYGLPENINIVLYAPTFRNSYDVSVYNMDIKKCVDCVSNKFGSKFVFMIRLHPNFAGRSSNLLKEAIDATDYPDSQELLAGVDVVISDYSGMAFDFALTNRPVFLYATDKESYFSRERKQTFMFDEIPFSFSESIEDLCQNINAFDYPSYLDKIANFKKQVGYFDNYNSSSKICCVLKDLI